jgi:uncharacterized protein YwgA
MKTEWNEGYEKGYADAETWFRDIAKKQKEKNYQIFKEHNQDIDKLVTKIETMQTLNLTDEEIEEVWFSFKGGFKDFARAILTKAQEK